ncbi:response regulator [Oceanimonas pelagia]|uniref:histidine kinase n=1 Tax=Oceanimonas pelagia TaxID=3028314 RepID=A0AA50KMI5_9GAMM|nr:response regulator [Oceanimonas pelagia]WMC09828.1 response regulator [Oceanimonas pelagia]
MSFRLKTMLGVALIVGSLLLLLIWSSLRYLQDASHQEAVLRAETTSSLFAELVREAVLASDLARLESLASQALAASDMAYVRIMDNEQWLVEAGDTAARGTMVHAGADVLVNDRRYGRVELGLRTERAEGVIAGARHHLLLLAAGGMILVALFSLALGACLTRGLSRLTQAAEAISRGEDPAPIAVSGNGELAITSRAFNTMAEQLTRSRRDMEERLQIRQESRRHAAISAALVEANMDAVVIIDLDDTIVEFSSMAEKLFGYTRAEAIGRSMAELLIPPEVRDHHRRGMQHYRDTGHGPILGKHIELDAMRAGGELFPAELTVQTIQLEGSVLFAGFMRDISERKAAEQALKDARVRAEAASRAKSRFLAHMSHEIRSPLNAVLGSVSLLLEDKLTREQRLYAQTAESSGKALLGLINNILDFSRIEAGQLQPDKQQFRLDELLSDIAAHIALCAREKQLQTALIAEPGLPVQLTGDATRLRQILINLLDNALKFTDTGAVSLLITLEAKTNNGVELAFTVQDSGIGIPAEEQSALFEEFQQVDSSDSTRHGGSGLGLSISRGLCRAMGGELVFAHASQAGSVFVATLPLEYAGPVPAVPQHGGIVLCAGLHPLLLNAVRLACQPRGMSVAEWRPDEPLPAAGEQAMALLLHHDLPAPARSSLLTQAAQQGLEHIIELGREDASPLEPAITDRLPLPLLAGPLLRRLGRERSRPAQAVPADTFPSASAPQQGGRLLLAEDSPANQLVARAMLERAGYRVTIANNGLEALEACARQPFDLILMDLRMPQMDGLEATRRLRTQSSMAQVPIVALTANVSQQDIERCLAAGMDDFIPKPINSERLLATLVRHLSPGTRQAGAGTSPAPVEPPRPLPLLDEAAVHSLFEAMGADRFAGTMGLFLDENRERLARLEQAIARQDMESATLEAHTIKGCAGTFGAPQLQDWARQMEAACRSQDDTSIHRLAAHIDALGRQTETRFQHQITSLTGEQHDSESTQGTPPAGAHSAG